MVTLSTSTALHGKPAGATGRQPSRHRLLPALLLLGALPAHAIPPPPRQPPLLREARMTVTVQLVEAGNGTVSKISKLCEVKGRIPVYADEGGAASVHARAIPGCSMTWNGRKLDVYVRGAKAMSAARISYATARVGVELPGAAPACPICGPQPLADSSAQIRVSGNPRSMKFGLTPNPVSMLRARPTVWLEAEVEIVE